MSALWQLPTGWMWAHIRDVVKSTDTVDPTTYPEQQFQYVDIGSIDNDRNVIAKPKLVLGRDAPSRARRRIEPGDVLFSTVRTYLRNVAIVPESLDSQLASTGFALLRA